MKTAALGKTGEEVSALCLGTMYFGSKNDRETSWRLLDRYVEAGGAFLDTANAYARWIEGCRGGESETVLAEWLARRGSRDSLFIATKMGFPTPVDGLEFGLSARQIERACEASLKRMGIETIDLYYAHADDRGTPMEERLEAFSKLIRAGKVRFIGASNHLDWRLEEARCLAGQNGWSDFCCAQQRFSYVRPQAGAVYDPHVVVNDEHLDYCRNRGITLLAYSPLLGGAYTREDRSLPEQYAGPDTDLRLETLRAVAEETGATPSQAVLAWMLQSDPPIVPLVAASRLEHLDENLASLDVELSDDQLTRLSQAGNRPALHPNRQRRLPPGAKEG